MYGTVTHMPPELIKSGIASKAVDVYALVRRSNLLACCSGIWSDNNTGIT